MQTSETPVVRLQGISKHFGAVAANREIDLDIHSGRVKALLGENGAGKSTLMSILSGRLQPDRGRIVIAGQSRSGLNTREAIAAGIGMVYQHFMLIEALTVAENVTLGQIRRFWLSAAEMNLKVKRLAARYGLDIDPQARVADLSMGERQRVEILKLLHRQSRVLIFDEPTAVLTPQESGQLFEALRQMASQGKAVVFISHKLAEVMAIADDIAILRRGRIVEDLPADRVQSGADLARRMVGRPVVLQVNRQPMEPRQRVMRTDKLEGGALKGISLDLRQGEILALVGVAGNGQKDLVETICGLRAPERGTVRILGMSWRRFYSRANRGRRLSYIPEDRLGLAVCRGLDMTENFLLTTRHHFCAGPWLKRTGARRQIVGLVRTFNIQPPGVETLARQLSGGNLQKLVLAREFFRRPRLIVAEQPTQGLDVGATEEVWTLLLEARERAGVLLVTGDLTEALTLADRLAVIFEGRIMDIFPNNDDSRIEDIGLLMAGMTPAAVDSASPPAEPPTGTAS